MQNYPRAMNELDHIWSQMLTKAIENANAAGRADIADYLRLKAANDVVRQTAVTWLFESFAELASEAALSRPGITIERDEPHNFAFRGANIVGSLLSIRQGVRCLTVEAGWTRTPSDGFMRGGAMAFARVSHFGIPRASMELGLNRVDTFPLWQIVKEDSPLGNFGTDEIRQHISVFLG